MAITPIGLTRKVMWIVSIGDEEAMHTDNQANYSGFARLPLGDNADDLRALAEWILGLSHDEIRQLCDPTS